MPQILIYYEHKAREYQYCHALKYELKRRGYTVGICHLQNRHTWLYKIFSKPKVVLCGSVSKAYVIGDFDYFEDSCDFLRGRAPFYINLQIEQLFRDEQAHYNIVLDDDVQERVFNICWGPRRKKQMLSQGVSSEQIFVTGAMHLDFLRPEFFSLYFTKKEMAKQYRIPEDKRWVLYISSYTYVSAPPEKMKSWFRHIVKADPDFQWEDMVLRKTSSVQSQNTTLDWIDRYLVDNDDIFIYRPHPGERITEEMDILRKTYPGRFLWLKEGSVQQWIAVCDVINNWISTAVVEAYVAKKPVNIVQPVEVPKDLLPIILDDCQKIRTYEEFAVAQQKETVFSEETFPVNRELLHDYYLIDDNFAYLRVCDLIEEVYRKPAPDVGKSKFTIRTIFEKWFLFRAYRSFYAVTRIKLSRIIPFKRKGIKNRELEVDIGMASEDILITPMDRENARRIKKIVYEIGKKRSVSKRS